MRPVKILLRLCVCSASLSLLTRRPPTKAAHSLIIGNAAYSFAPLKNRSTILRPWHPRSKARASRSSGDHADQAKHGGGRHTFAPR